MVTVEPYGRKWALIWGGHAHKYITVNGDVKTWDTQEAAQKAADATNAMEEAKHRREE